MQTNITIIQISHDSAHLKKGNSEYIQGGENWSGEK